jgi:ribosome-associated protein
MEELSFSLEQEFIELQQLLKLLGLAESGGGAKALIASGSVRVDDVPEIRRGRKIRTGMVVAIPGARITVS